MEKKNTLFVSGVNAGLIIAAVGIVIFILEYVFGIMPVGIVQPILIGLFSIALTIVVLVLLLKNYRTKNEGVLSFRDAFLFAFIALVTGGLISTIFSYLFMNYFDSQYITKMMEAQRSFMESYLTGKVPEEKLSETLNSIDDKLKNMGTLAQTIKGFFINVVVGAIIALIVAAIMKKQPNIFEDKASGGVI